jgi:hypothetical protein
MKNILSRPAALLLAIAMLSGCDRASDASRAASARSVAAADSAEPASPPSTRANVLRMRIDGVEWVADHDLFGAVHPPGMDRALLIAGARGPKDASEQTFNLNLFGIDAPGTMRVKGNDIRGDVAQIGNLSPQRFLVGAGFGFDLQVEVIAMHAAPSAIEARFAGTLVANDGSTVRIEDGEFRYRE